MTILGTYFNPKVGRNAPQNHNQSLYNLLGIVGCVGALRSQLPTLQDKMLDHY